MINLPHNASTRPSVAALLGVVTLASLIASSGTACEQRAGNTPLPPSTAAPAQPPSSPPDSSQPASSPPNAAPAPSSAPTAPPAPTSTPSSTEPRASTDPWVVPPGWTRQPGEKPMRVATYIAQDTSGPVEIAITRFPGRVGGELANVNRWRGQLGLAPLTAESLDSTLARFTAEGFDAYTTIIEGTSGAMFAAGVYDASLDATWFVRVSAASDVVKRMAPSATDFARSIAKLPPAGAN